MLAELYTFAYICFTLGSLLMIGSIMRYAWYAHFKIPRKARGPIVLDESQREGSKNITLLIPAFKETEVIENTMESIAKMNYYPGKFHALIVLDEKEVLEKERDSRIILPTARDILDGRLTNDALRQRFQSVRTDLKGLTRKDLSKWIDYYLQKAEILSIAVLSEFNGPELNAEVTPIAFTQLRYPTLKNEITGDGIHQHHVRVKELIAREQGSEGERERYLADLYERHPAFETTIDVVRQLKGRYRSQGGDLMEYTIVPANYDGSYRHPQLLPEAVPSSKGRALNWGLNEVERMFPQTDIVGVYDSDARPHPDVLAYINSESQKNDSKYVFYQGPIYLVRNFFHVHWVCKQSGLQGTCWHRILYPIYIFKHQDDVIHFSGTNYFYTIDAIRKTEGYPPFHPTEDLGLAYDVYALRLEGKLPDMKIVPHPYEELEQTTQTWSAWFKQQYRWASGGPYQLRRLRKNKEIPKKEKARMMTRLLAPFPVSIYALFLGMAGLLLTALSLLGLGIYPALPPELEMAIQYIMLIGFTTFLATPLAVYLWSIQKAFLKADSHSSIVVNLFIILFTTIPYFIVASVPIIHAWTRPLSGWGSKTPRTNERIRSREEGYLQASRSLIMTHRK